MNTTRALAEYVADLPVDSLSADNRDAASRCVLDLFSAAAAGVRSSSVDAMRRVTASQYGRGPAGIWFAGERTSLLGAVLCNSAAASVLDLDDGFRTARGHPGAAVIPAALAAAAGTATTAEELMAAIVVGYEVSVRVANGRLFYSSSGTWSAYAAIAAAGRIRRTGAGPLAHALAIATLTAPVLKGKGGSQFAHLSGSDDVKEGIPWGSLNGAGALLMAEEGLTGPLDILDRPAHFAAERIVTGLGGPPLIGGTYFKPYACCRHLHAPIDALAALMSRHAFSAADVVAVEVHTYGATFNLRNSPEPANLVDAQFSVPFSLGICAVLGNAALLPMDEAVLADARVRAFANRVTLHRDPAIDARFPIESPARVVVVTRDGRYESPVTTPRGDPSAPLTWFELEEKFRVATRKTLNEARQREVLRAVLQLRAGDIAPLHAVLGQPRERVLDPG